MTNINEDMRIIAAAEASHPRIIREAQRREDYGLSLLESRIFDLIIYSHDVECSRDDDRAKVLAARRLNIDAAHGPVLKMRVRDAARDALARLMGTN